MSCDVGCRCSLDLTLLWLWRRPVATVPVGPLAWELPYAVGVALRDKRAKKRNLSFCFFCSSRLLLLHLCPEVRICETIQRRISKVENMLAKENKNIKKRIL